MPDWLNLNIISVALKHTLLRNVVYTVLFVVSMTSCNKDDLQPKIELIDSDYKNLQLNTGFVDNGIAIEAEDWSVEYVKDAVTGDALLDKDGKPLVLSSLGSIEVESGWLKLKKKKEDNLLSISLQENFSANPRKFVIGILADDKRDEISFTQRRGEGYAIVKKEIVEVPGSRREYTSDEGITSIILSNNTSTAKNMETSGIFKDVNYLSEFKSEDFGAFDWVNAQDTSIFMDEVLRDGAIYWSEKVSYKEGLSEEPYLKAGNKAQLLVQPHSNIQVRGEMLYLERESLYTFTIKNLSSGHTFDISGTWKQKIPLVPTTHLFD